MPDPMRRAEPWSAGPGPGACDAVFYALAHPYRRHVLTTLVDARGEATVTELAASLHAAGVGSADPGGPYGIETIEASLYHVHLPNLTDAGLVEFTPDDGLVAATARSDRVVPLLEIAQEL